MNPDHEALAGSDPWHLARIPLAVLNTELARPHTVGILVKAASDSNQT